MKKKLYLMIGALVVALLAGGAFMAMRLLNAKAQGSSILDFSGGSQRVEEVFKLIRAPELPQQRADLMGLVTSVQNNSVFVAPNNNMTVSVNNGQVQQPPTPAGPYIEVVFAKNTKIWRDATADNLPPPSAGSSGTKQVQQKLAPADLSEINAGDTYLEVWGPQRGDRLSAEVIVIHLP